jgi:hypothetical protein
MKPKRNKGERNSQQLKCTGHKWKQGRALFENISINPNIYIDKSVYGLYSKRGSTIRTHPLKPSR